MDHLPYGHADESIVFRASCATSLWDFLKTDIGKNKGIECHFSFELSDARLPIDLVRRGVEWIRFTDTDKLYPPNFKPTHIVISTPKGLTSALMNTLPTQHLYCKFEQKKLTFIHKRLLNLTKVVSVSFSDGHTSYAPF